MYAGFCGRSVLYDPLGVVVGSLGEQEGLVVGEIDLERLGRVRSTNPSCATSARTCTRSGRERRSIPRREPALRSAFAAGVLVVAVLCGAAGPPGAPVLAVAQPTAAPSPAHTPLRSFARTVTIVSSRGSIWGYDQQSVTILDERGGFVNSAPDTNDTRLIALLAALSADCVPKLSAATLGLTPELMHALTPAQIQFGQVSPAQRKWYDTTLDQTALERTVERYYAQDPEPEDAQYARVRVTVSDSTGVVMSASSTAQQQLLLPWYVTHRGLATCLSWDPRLSRAISAYLTGDLTDRAAGSTLPEAIASWYVTLNRGQSG